jgi:WD40 repeat protein
MVLIMSKEYIFSHTLSDRLGYLSPTAISTCGQLLAVGCSDGFARVINVATSKIIIEVSPSNFSTPFFDLTLTPNGKTFVTSDDSIRIWDIATGAKVKEFKIARAVILHLGVSPNSKFLIGEGSGYKEITIIWDLIKKKKIFQSGYVTGVRHPVILSNFTKIITRRWQNQCLQILDFVTGERQVTFPDSFAAGIISVDNNAEFLVAGCNASIRVWNLLTGEQIRVIHKAPFTDLVIVTPNGENVLSKGYQGKVIIWDIKTGDRLSELQNHTGELRNIVMSQDGSTIITSFMDGVVQVWK